MYKILKAAAYLGFREFCEEPVSQELEQSFVAHVSRYGLSFQTKQEYEFRLNLYAEMDAKINQINAKETNFSVGHNFMSTWTKSEYRKLLGYKGHAGDVKEEVVELPETDEVEVDWRKKGAVNPIKDQSGCGSCWAFSATCAIEGAHFLKTGELLSLSVQQIVSCDTTSTGCQGGTSQDAFKYLESNLQELESDYPYTSGDFPYDNGDCKYNASLGKIGVESFTWIPPKSVAQLKAAIAKQPVAISVEADKDVFAMYSGGILDDPSCWTGNLDHAVSAVGYGSEGGQEYYIVRNSWGTWWGDKGYAKIAAVDGLGICGIQQESLYPALKN